MIKNLSPAKLSHEDKLLRCHSKSMRLLENKEFDKALKCLEMMSQINTKSKASELSTLNNLSVVYMKQKLSNKAMVTLIKALVKSQTQPSKPAQVGTLLNLTAAASSLGIHSEALSYGLKALQLLSGSSDLNLIIIAHYNVAVEYINLHKFTDAEETLKKAISLMNENQITDQSLFGLLIPAINYVFSKKKDLQEKPRPKPELTTGRRLLKKSNSNAEVSHQIGLLVQTKRSEKIVKPAVDFKEIRVSCRNLSSSRKKADKNGAESNTSSTESIKNTSQLLRQHSARIKVPRKSGHSEKASEQSTPLSRNSSLLSQESELGNRIQHIGDYLNNIERKLNDFVDLCKPLKILAEDPDEQLDSHRVVNCNMKAIVYVQRIARRKFYLKNIAAMKIQRAFRKYRALKNSKMLIKFKDNPLFKRSRNIAVGGKKRKSVY